MRVRRKAYGWVRDLPDHRDYPYAPPASLVRNLPQRVDLRPRFSPPYDQGQLESCTANALAAAIQYARRIEALGPDFLPSRLFIYFNARSRRGCERCDSGAQIRDAVKSVATLGVCPEGLWPYRVPRFEVMPASRCFHAAAQHRAVSYYRLRRGLHLASLRACLASGHPFVFGMAVYESFETVEVARTGTARLPRRGERHVGRGHAVLAVGYDGPAKRFIVRNSWGVRWGQHGYFTLPDAYIAEPDLTDDFWTLRAVAG
jgi:C1A family cysteine protease